MKFLLIFVTLVLTACSSTPATGPTYQDNYYQGGSGAYLNGGPRVMPAGDVNSMTLIYNKYPNTSAQQPCHQCRPQWRPERHEHHHPQNYRGPYQRADYRQPRPLPPVQQVNQPPNQRMVQQPQQRTRQGSSQQRANHQHGNGARF